MTPEGKVKKKVSALLKERGVYYFMPVQNGMGKPGLDYHCIHKGVGFCVETKAPGGKLTARQELTATEVRDAGGYVFKVEGAGSLAHLEHFLLKIELMEA